MRCSQLLPLLLGCYLSPFTAGALDHTGRGAEGVLQATGTRCYKAQCLSWSISHPPLVQALAGGIFSPFGRCQPRCPFGGR